MSCSSQGKPYCKYEDAERQCRDLLTERKVLKELVLARQENKVAEQTPTNTQSAAIAKIAAEMERTADSRCKSNSDYNWGCDVSKWARQLRAL
jgi:hypothetical protein